MPPAGPPAGAADPARTLSAREVLWPVIPLLGGVALLMGAMGLQSSLVALRATSEGFASLAVGLISSAYFLGFLVGARLSASWIGRVGHVRAFGAFASIGSAMVLIHVLAISVPVWVVARFLSGVCLSGLVVIIESWLNSSTPRELRGRVLSTYMTINLGGYALGQFLLTAAPIESFELFAVVSLLLSAAMLPVILSRRSNPQIVAVESLPFRRLFARAPGGVVASAMAGLTWGAIGGYSVVVASQAGLDRFRVTLFVSSFLAGHLLLEAVIGAVSDRMDRRLVIMTVAAAGTGFSLVAAFLTGMPTLLIVLGVAIGATTLPLYSLSIALTGDRLEASEMVSAAGTLVRVNGLGAAAGPVLAALMTSSPLGVAGFYVLVAGGTTVVVLVAGGLLIRDGTLAPRVPYARAAARATMVVTQSVMGASSRAIEKRQVKKAQRAERRRSDDRPARRGGSNRPGSPRRRGRMAPTADDRRP